MLEGLEFGNWKKHTGVASRKLTRPLSNRVGKLTPCKGITGIVN